MSSYIVTGFYTPNYEPLASAFRANLDAHAVPHHLYAVEHIGNTWLAQTLRKPEIVLRAMTDHPDATVILCDVDCLVTGHLDGIIWGDADVKLALRSNGHGYTAASRVLMVRQTNNARRLMEEWHLQCQAANRRIVTHGRTRDKNNDELLLMDAIVMTPGVKIEMLPLGFAGAEVGSRAARDSIIIHDSAHDKARPTVRVRKAVKRIRRRLISAIVGKPYTEWKYGSACSRSNWK